MAKHDAATLALSILMSRELVGLSVLDKDFDAGSPACS
jgi:hypothetical protein